MALSVGIVGLPNAGKSTLFNALSTRRLAETAPRPFTTIDPHEAVVAVPDDNLTELCKLIGPDECAPASVTFTDIAGLVKGSHKGEGMGNQFLAKIREVSLIVHVVRAFRDPYVTHPHQTHEPGTLEQVLDDIEIVNLELQLANINKHQIYVLNFDEKDLNTDKAAQYMSNVSERFGDEAMGVAAKLEEELADLKKEERKQYLSEAGIKESGLVKLIKASYKKLGLISFYTVKGGEEVHAWSLREGKDIIKAAETVHSDFADNFIKAEVIGVEELLSSGGWKKAKEEGKVRIEGRDYVVQERDVIEFKVNA